MHVITSIWQRAKCQWSCFPFSHSPFWMTEQKFCCFRELQSQNPSATFCHRETLRKVSCHLVSHSPSLHVSCTWDKQINSQQHATQEPETNKLVQAKRLHQIPPGRKASASAPCCVILWLYWHLKVTLLTVFNSPAWSFLLLFPLSDLISENRRTVAMLLRNTENLIH